MTEDIRIKVGNTIANLREKKGLSQVKLAELSGVGRAHIIRIEQGKYNVRIDILERIAKALGSTITLQEE